MIGGTARYTSGAVVVTVSPPSISDAAGSYRGFASSTNPPAAAASGFVQAPSDSPSGQFTVTVQPSGIFTAKLTLGTKIYSFKAAFDADGVYAKEIKVAGKTLSISLNADFTDGTDRVSGSIAFDGTTYQVGSDKTVSDDRSQILKLAPSYTLVLPADSVDDPSNPRPQGTGYATATIKKTGVATLVGKLADGSSFSAGGALEADGSLNAFARLYKNTGLVAGRITFQPTAQDPNTSDIAGSLEWIKPAQASGLFAAGFDTTLVPFGATYTVPPANQRVLTTGSDGSAVLQFSDADSSLQIVKDIVISAKNKTTYPSPVSAADKLTLTFTAKSGLFTGKFLYPDSGKQDAFSGVVLQKSTHGEGFFLGTDFSGVVKLDPAQ